MVPTKSIASEFGVRVPTDNTVEARPVPLVAFIAVRPSARFNVLNVWTLSVLSRPFK